MKAELTLPIGIAELGRRTARRWERSLAKREVFDLSVRERVRLSALEGSFWVTRDGDPADHVLEPGAAIRLEPGDHATIQALAAGRFAVGSV